MRGMWVSTVEDSSQSMETIIISGAVCFQSSSRFYVIDTPLGTPAGIQALSQAISHGAMHDSSERDPPPRCYPGTRKKVADDIIHWLEDPCTSTSVLWVNGRAGVGKSALMQTIAELLRDNNLDFGGCFFFQRDVSGCNRKGYLFSTSHTSLQST